LEARGIHCIAELYDCPSGLLNDETFISGALGAAVEQGMATLLHEVSHKFHPQGVTALALIAESHVAIHTWPEVGYAAVDVFTCGDHASAERACGYLARALQCDRYSVKKLRRGLESISEVASQGTVQPVEAPAPITTS
jgi:S-adenosylmethionine decarboxylase